MAYGRGYRVTEGRSIVLSKMDVKNYSLNTGHLIPKTHLVS